MKMDELRPCKIEIPKLANYRIYAGGIRILNAIFPPESHNAKFHRWVDGGSEDFPKTKISGLVEYEDGTIHIVPSEYITFVDT